MLSQGGPGRASTLCPIPELGRLGPSSPLPGPAAPPRGFLHMHRRCQAMGKSGRPAGSDAWGGGDSAGFWTLVPGLPGFLSTAGGGGRGGLGLAPCHQHLQAGERLSRQQGGGRAEASGASLPGA